MEPLFSFSPKLLQVPNNMEKYLNNPTHNYILDNTAMDSTTVDIKEYPNYYVFIIDMLGLQSDNIKVQVQDESVLKIIGERKKEEDDHVKLIHMERRVSKFTRKFILPDYCNMEAISARCQDGVLNVNVPKLPLAEPNKHKTIEVYVA